MVLCPFPCDAIAMYQLGTLALISGELNNLGGAGTIMKSTLHVAYQLNKGLADTASDFVVLL